MEREQVIQQGRSQMQQGISDALGMAFDEGVREGQAMPKEDGAQASGSSASPSPSEDSTPFAQADIDAAVEAAVSPLAAKIKELEASGGKSGIDQDELEEQIADQLAAFAQGLRDRTQKAAPVDQSASSDSAEGDSGVSADSSSQR